LQPYEHGGILHQKLGQVTNTNINKGSGNHCQGQKKICKKIIAQKFTTIQGMGHPPKNVGAILLIQKQGHWEPSPQGRKMLKNLKIHNPKITTIQGRGYPSPKKGTILLILKKQGHKEPSPIGQKMSKKFNTITSKLL
jgi:hypothetical protein